MWERCEFIDLLHELALYDEWNASISNTSRVTYDESRSKRVTEKISVGELSKALQAQMAPEPYSGDMAKLEALHPPKPDYPYLDPLPTDIEQPKTTADHFYQAICSASRATCQTNDGWHTDLLKAINIDPTEEEPDPLFGLREFSTAYASGFLPVSEELYLTLSGSKLAAVAKENGDP